MKKTLVFAAVALVAGLAQAAYTWEGNGAHYDPSSEERVGSQTFASGEFIFGDGFNIGGMWDFNRDRFVSYANWDAYLVANPAHPAGFGNAEVNKAKWENTINTDFASGSEVTPDSFANLRRLGTLDSKGKLTVTKNSITGITGLGNAGYNQFAIVIANTSGYDAEEGILFATFVFIPEGETDGLANGYYYPETFTYKNVGDMTNNIPEPTSGLLLLLGMAGLALKRKHV